MPVFLAPLKEKVEVLICSIAAARQAPTSAWILRSREADENASRGTHKGAGDAFRHPFRRFERYRARLDRLGKRGVGVMGPAADVTPRGGHLP